jgi:ribosome recycling factor
MLKEQMNELRSKMHGALEAFKRNLSGLRTGRASTALLENLQVKAYGGMVPINQVGSVNVSDARTITVQVWDASVANAVVKGIQESGLGLNPLVDGTIIRVVLPDLSQERREDLKKKSASYAEDAKISVRNIRRDGNEYLKKQEKQVSEDEIKRQMEEVQKLTDDFIKMVDETLAEKVQDIMKF